MFKSKKAKIFSLLGLIGITGASLVFALGSGYPFKSWQVFGLGAFRNTPQFYTAVPSAGSSTHFYPGTDNTNDLGSSSLGFRTIYGYDLTLQDDVQLAGANSTILFGSATTAVSTATTSGNSQGHYFTAYLSGATPAVEGSLLVAAAPVTASGGVAVAVGGATSGLTSWVGIAAAAASTGSVVGVYDGGWVLALTSGTVSPGDTLVSTSAVAGYLMTQTAPTTGADVAVALATGTVAGGLTRVRLR